MFDPFASRSGEFFSGPGASPFSGRVAAQRQQSGSAINSAIQNKSYVSAARRAAAYAQQRQDAAQGAANANASRANTTALIGTGISAVAGIGAALI